MSASTERKNHQAAREAGTDKKTLAMEKEAKESESRLKVYNMFAKICPNLSTFDSYS